MILRIKNHLKSKQCQICTLASELNGQNRDNAMFVDQDDFIDRFIDKVISDKPNCLIVKNKNNDEIGYLSTKRLSEILKR